MAASVGIDPTQPDAEPGLTPEPMDERRRANFNHFITTDLAAVRNDPGCRDRLTTTTRTVPAAGRTTPTTVYDYQAAQSPGTLLGRPVVTFPGGRNGNTTHPRAWAQQLRAIFRTVGPGRSRLAGTEWTTPLTTPGRLGGH